MTNPQMTPTPASARSTATRCLAVTTLVLGLIASSVMFSQTASTSPAAAKPATTAVPPLGATAFPTAQAAASALIQAASTFN